MSPVRRSPGWRRFGAAIGVALYLLIDGPAPLHASPIEPLDLGDLGAPSFESFTARDGLPDGVITVIGVDADGFAWAASPRGLYRFIGHRWQREVSEQTAGRVHRRMSLGDDGTLWLASQDGGLGRHRQGKWQFQNRTSGLPTDHNYRISQLRDARGRLKTWLLTVEAGLFELVDCEWRPDPGNASLPSSQLLSMTSTTELFGEPRQWIGTGERGLWFRREGEAGWKPFAVGGKAAGQIEDLQRSIEPGSESLWISVFGAGLYRIDARETRHWSAENGALRSNQIYGMTLAEDPGGTTVWVASRDGLVRIQGDATEIFDRRHGLPSDQIRGTHLWRSPGGEEVLWIATESGVARAVFTADRWRTASLMGAGSIGVFGVLVEPDGRGGERLWVASSRDGLGLYERGRWRTFSTGTGELPGNNLRLIERARDLDGHDALWTGVEEGHLLRIGDDLRIRPVQVPWPLEPGQEVLDMLSREQDTRRELWFATRRGIFRWREDGWMQVPVPRSNRDLRATALAEQVDRSGRSWLWASTSQGLARLDGDEWTLLHEVEQLPPRNVIGLTLVTTADGRQVLWIGSSFDAVIRLDVTDPRAPVVLPGSELPPPIDVTAYSALHDSKGRVYVCTNDGIQQLTPDATGGWSERVFRRRDGLVHEECNTNAQFIDRHDRFWTGTLGGLTVFDPGTSQSSSAKQLRLIGLKVDGRSVDPASLVLQPGTRELQAEFTLQSWQREDETRYRTQLLGFDPVPGPWKAQPARTFASLPPGDYRLRIEGKGFAGVEARPIELSVVVLPSWWQRRPVQGGFVLGGFLLVFASANWRTRSLRAQKQRLEREVAARTEELNEANSRLRELSYTDALTGLPNRRMLLESLESLIDPRSGRGASCSLIFIDVDHFKDFNDRLGHPAGDAALRTIAESLRECAPPFAVLARYGGEELACLLPDGPLEEAADLAERMRAEVERRPIPIPGSSATEHVTISAGVATATLRSDSDIHALLRAADKALYVAKNEGRNCVRVEERAAV